MVTEAAISIAAPTRIAVRATVLALLAVLLAAAPAAADTGWRCSAGTVAGSVLGQALPGAVSAGSETAACTDASLSAPLSVPPVLEATLLGASTAGNRTSAAATGGVADLRVRSVPELPITLPPVEIPDNLTQLTVPLLGITVDLTPAIEAALPDRALPSADLVGVSTAVAYAAGQCSSGTPAFAGTSQVAGVTVLGQDVGTDALVDQTLTLLDTQSIPLSSLDLSLVQLPAGVSLALVQQQLAPVLAGLPPIEVPATVAQVTVTPGERTQDARGVLQHALRVEAAIAGQSVADLILGRAAVSASGVDCSVPAPPPAPAAPAPEPDAADLALACTKRDIVLIDVVPRGRRVKLLGAADKRFAGRTVRIVFAATGRTVARATVGADGSFSATAPMPGKRVRHTNRARYRAVLGSERSLNLKLMRRMIVNSVRSADGFVTIRGRVVRPLARPVKPVVVKRRVTCKRSEVVARVRPSRSGRFEVTVPAPTDRAAAVYRLSTRVRNKPNRPKLYPTFTLPRAVDL